MDPAIRPLPDGIKAAIAEARPRHSTPRRTEEYVGGQESVNILREIRRRFSNFFNRLSPVFLCLLFSPFNAEYDGEGSRNARERERKEPATLTRPGRIFRARFTRETVSPRRSPIFPLGCGISQLLPAKWPRDRGRFNIPSH